MFEEQFVWRFDFSISLVIKFAGLHLKRGLLREGSRKQACTNAKTQHTEVISDFNPHVFGKVALAKEINSNCNH